MAHPDDFDFYLEVGCRLCDHSLGVQKMPAGYHLMLDADGMYFFWMERSTGRESAPHWNKWSVYRGAKSDAARRRTPDMDGKKKLEELVALAGANAGHPQGKWWENVSHADIRSISDAYKAMEAENERAAEVIGHLLRCEYDGAGLCDCVDNAGKHYPSQYLADWIKAAEEWASARNAKESRHEG